MVITKRYQELRSGYFPEGESRYSWTIDFVERRAKARVEMQPLLEESARLRAAVVDLKEQFKRLKKEKADPKKLEALEIAIKDQDKAARDLEAKAAGIDAAVFDLKAVNPNAIAKVDIRTPQDIIDTIQAQSEIVAQALGKLKALLAEAE